MYKEYRVFMELKYLNLYGCNAYSKFYHEIASVDATVYERVNVYLFSNLYLGSPVAASSPVHQVGDDGVSSPSKKPKLGNNS